MHDQWDCVLNDLELGRKEFLVLTDQYSIEIFSCYLRLLPSCSSINHQTNIESTHFPKIVFLSPEFDPHLLLENFLRTEEKCFIFHHWVRLIELRSWFNINPRSFKSKCSPWKWEVESLLGFASAFDWLANANTSVFISSFLLVVPALFVDQVCDQLVQSMRNSDPRVRNVLCSQIQF